MANEHLNNQIGSPTSSNKSDSLSDNNLERARSLCINTNHDESSCSSASSISPISHSSSTKLKRHREESNDNEKNTPRSSPGLRPTKTAKMGYSIMNLLANDKKETSNSNKENSVSSSPSSATTPQPNQNSNSSDTTDQTNSQTQYNPFMLNPFLAAAAAAAANSVPNNQSFLNNISNLALLTKQQNQAEFWPWFNMAAMSAFYGLDKGYPNLFPGSNVEQNSQSLLQQTIRNSNLKSKDDSNLHIGQMANNVFSNENNNTNENDLESPLRNLSTGLNKTSTPSNIINQNRFMFNNNINNNNNNNIQRLNSIRNSDYLNENMNKPNSARSGSCSSISPTPIQNQNKYLPHESFSLINKNQENNTRKLMNRSFGVDEDEREENNHRNGIGGASMGDDDDLDDDNLEAGDDEDLDGSNNGDSFDNLRKKKTRTVFSRNQVFQLESTFDMKRYLSSSERSSLANSLQLTETQIKIWFQNRRNKWKRQLAAEIEANNNLPQSQAQAPTQPPPPPPQHHYSQKNNQMPTNNQKLLRVPVLYQSGDSSSSNGSNSRHHLVQSDLDNANLIPSSSSSSSSSHSSLTSPSNNTNINNSSSVAAAAAAAAVLNNMAVLHGQSQANQNTSVNPASLLSPSMLAAAAAASSLYYAAANSSNSSSSSSAQFPNLNLNLANQTAAAVVAQSLKQPLSSIL